jgi:hypothetical protein
MKTEKRAAPRRGKVPLLLLVLAAAAVLDSCIGLSADINLKPDGSGKITLEYRVSPLLEALGRLDGNERWQTVPAGRADFERTLARLPDMRLVSFSAKDSGAGGGDVINRAELEFKNIEALLAFFDPSGKRAAFDRGGTGGSGKNRLSLTLLDPEPDPVETPVEGAAKAGAEDLRSLLRELSRDYELQLSLSVAGTASLSLTPERAAPARVVSPGKKVSLTIKTAELLGLSGGLGVIFTW